MSAPVAEITRLCGEHFQAVAAEHHKDRDCHWSIEVRWSYGDGPVFIVQHDGYVSEPWEHGESRPFDSWQEAADELVRVLREETHAILERER